MLLFIIDNEEHALKEMQEVIAEASEGADIATFSRCEEALDAIRKGMRPNAVFSDIVMPGISGLEFAVRLKTLSPDSRIVFTTAYEEYAVEAFRIKANGYLLKPLTLERVREELAYLPKEMLRKQDKLVVRCFGYFDVFWNQEPVIFGRKQSKELLAYLIDRNGAACTSEEISLALWERAGDEKAEKNRIRVLINDLRNSLRKIGMEDVLIREHRTVAVQKDRIDCDYYRMLDGDMDYLNSYRGEYMKQYSWAELTSASLYLAGKKEKSNGS